MNGLRKPLTPFVGIARSVKHTVDGYRVPNMLVEDGIRKATDQAPAIVDDSVQLWGTADCFNTSINTTQKLFTQTAALTFIPAVSLREVLLSLRRKDQLSGHSGGGLFA